MDSREIYAALFEPRGQAGEPTGEWSFVGDAVCFDQKRFRKLLSPWGSDSEVWVAVSRTKAVQVTSELAALTVQQFLQLGEVRIADLRLTHFVQISTIGVARSWQRHA